MNTANLQNSNIEFSQSLQMIGCSISTYLEAPTTEDSNVLSHNATCPTVNTVNISCIHGNKVHPAVIETTNEISGLGNINENSLMQVQDSVGS